MRQHDILTWDMFIHKHVYCWGAHVSRMQHYVPERLSVKILHWRNRDWLDSVESVNSSSQCRSYKFRVWRYERQFTNCARNCERLASNKRAWNSVHLEKIVVWRCSYNS